MRIENAVENLSARTRDKFIAITLGAEKSATEKKCVSICESTANNGRELSRSLGIFEVYIKIVFVKGIPYKWAMRSRWSPLKKYGVPVPVKYLGKATSTDLKMFYHGKMKPRKGIVLKK